MFVVGSEKANIRTGLMAQLRALDVNQSIFLRDSVMNWNRLSTAVARAQKSSDGTRRRFTSIRVDGGFRVFRDA